MKFLIMLSCLFLSSCSAVNQRQRQSDCVTTVVTGIYESGDRIKTLNVGAEFFGGKPDVLVPAGSRIEFVRTRVKKGFGLYKQAVVNVFINETVYPAAFIIKDINGSYDVPWTCR